MHVWSERLSLQDARKDFCKKPFTNSLECDNIIFAERGALAQLVAHNTGSVGVRSSNLLCSTKTGKSEPSWFGFYRLCFVVQRKPRFSHGRDGLGTNATLGLVAFCICHERRFQGRLFSSVSGRRLRAAKRPKQPGENSGRLGRLQVMRLRNGRGAFCASGRFQAAHIQRHPVG